MAARKMRESSTIKIFAVSGIDRILALYFAAGGSFIDGGEEILAGRFETPTRRCSHT